MPWLLIIPGALLLGGAGLYWMFGGAKVVLYTTVFPEGANIAINHMDSSWTKAPFTSTQDLLSKLRGLGRVHRLVIIAHGGPDWFFDRSLTTSALGEVLAQHLSQGAVVGLAGCSAGRGPGESDTWGPAAFGPGGAQSYAGRLRDAIVAAGGPYLGEVRAHTLSGHVTANSSGRFFSFSRSGQAGEAWKPVEVDWSTWVDTMTGDEAHEWIIGG